MQILLSLGHHVGVTRMLLFEWMNFLSTALCDYGHMSTIKSANCKQNASTWAREQTSLSSPSTHEKRWVFCVPQCRLYLLSYNCTHRNQHTHTHTSESVHFRPDFFL